MPCKNTKGPSTVYTQHKTYFRSIKKDREPRKAMLEDFKTCLQAWIDHGERIVVFMDANEDIRHGKVNDMFNSINMWEQISRRHGSRRPLPATHNRNTNNIPIDGIWTNINDANLKCGYYGHGELLPSDHRPMFIQLSRHTVFGHNPPHIHRYKVPDLPTTDPRIRSRYNDKIKKNMKDNKIPQMLKLMRHLLSAAGPKSEEQMKEIRSIHTKLIEFRKNSGTQAATKARKKHTGAVDNSPKMTHLFKHKELWTKVVLKLERLHMGSRQIRRLMKKFKNQDAFTIKKGEAIKRLRAAHRAVKEGKKHAAQWRVEHIQRLSEARAEANKTTAEGERKNHIAREKIRRTWNNIRIMHKRRDHTKLVIIYCTVNGIRMECKTKISMERACMRENEMRFTRCILSPFLQAPLLHLIGILANKPAVQAIFDGTIQIPPETDTYAAKLLLQLKKHPLNQDLALAPIKITARDNSIAWKRQRANTASEPSTLGFPHYIVGAYDPSVSELDACIRSAPYETGFAPEGFLPITDFQLLKDPKVKDVEGSRSIQLMDAQFNMNNKTLGRDTMRYAEAAGTISDSQFGSRKGSSAAKVATSKVLNYDIIRQKRIAAIHVGFDAAQCYDRMAHPPTILSMLKHGAPPTAVESMFRVFQQANHKVATAFGVSSETYGGEKRTAKGLLPIQGQGQGGGCGPTAFAVESSEMVGVMKQENHETPMRGPISFILLMILLWLFVDDSDLCQVAKDVQEACEELATRIQEALDCWVGTLMATGGAVNVNKTYCYFIQQKWNGNNWVYRTKEDMLGELTAIDSGGQRITIDRKEPSEASKTMGIFIAPSGNKKPQISYLQDKAEAYATEIRFKGPCSKNEIWISYTHTIRKTLDFPMGATLLNMKEWDSIMTLVNRAALPRAGMVRTFAHEVLYGPTKYQGSGQQHPYYRQELTHLLELVGEINSNSKQGIQYQISVEQLKLEQGYPGPWTDAPYNLLHKATTYSLIKTLWESCFQFGISIEDNFGTLPLRRVDDEFLMSNFVIAKYPSGQLKKLNECRCFLHAITLADISTMSGKSISWEAYNGVRAPQFLHNYEWPRDPPRLSKDHWDLWKKALDKCFLSNGTNENERRLATPLGNWLINPSTHWLWYFQPTTGYLFKRDGTEYQRYETPRLPRQNSTVAVYHNVETLQARPSDTFPACITQRQAGGIIFVSHSTLTTAPPSAGAIPIRPQNLAQAKTQLPASDSWAVEELSSTDDGASLATLLPSNQVIAVSDGSYEDGLSCSAFIITTKSAKGELMNPAISGRNCIPGNVTDQNSYRAELGGIMGVVVSLGILCNLHNITAGQVEIGLDGKEAMNQVFAPWDPKPDAPSYDMILDIRRKIKLLPLTLSGRHIEGHQDDPNKKNYKPFKHIDRWGKLNILMDKRAKKLLRQRAGHKYPNIPFGQEHLVVKFKGRKLAQIDTKYLYTQIYGKETQEYWATRHSIPRHRLECIHWDAQDKAFRRLPLGKKRWLMKHLTGQCGVGRTLVRRKYQDHDNCPLCNNPDETTSHVVLCKDYRAKTKFGLLMGELSTWMEESYTHQGMSRAIIQRLGEWHAGRTPQPIQGNRALQRTIREQDEIGWENFLNGRPTRRFAEYQHRHFQDIGKDNYGSIWLSKFITQAYDITFQMWQHRNEVKHNTTSPQDQAALQQLRFQVEDQFVTGLLGLPKQDHYLLDDKDKTLNYDLPHTRRWLNLIKGARQAQIRTEAALRNRLKASQKFMRDWQAQVKLSQSQP